MAFHKFEEQKNIQPHAVFLPISTQSHISAALKLAKLLHHRGFRISFVNTEFNHRRLLNAKGPAFLDDLPPDFQFLTIPDGLPKSEANATQDLVDLCGSWRFHMTAPFSDLIAQLNEKAVVLGSTSFPPVSCIISDGFMSFAAAPAADKFGIPVVYLWTMSAGTLLGFRQYPKLFERGFYSSKDCPTDVLNTIIDWIPGMKNMRLCDVPCFNYSDSYYIADELLRDFSIDAIIKGASHAKANIIHTIEPLEQDTLNALSFLLPSPVYGVGPFSLLLSQIPEEENHTKFISCNLWKEDRECFEWLNSREPSSVLYVNFGSIAFLTPQQLVEFAMGVANSKHLFLWIIRSDLVSGETTVFSQEFVEETKERCFTCEWCPQEEILYHPSIGGFLTHCGWNSTIESISAGVPMLCWPFFGDQRTVCRFVCTEWEIGIEIGKDAKRDEVERFVKEVMEGDRATKMKGKAMEWRKQAEEATLPFGSSSKNLDELVQILTK